MTEDISHPPFYQLFDNSYGGGSWNTALIAQADVQRRRAEKAEAETAQFKALGEAARAYRVHVYNCNACADEDSCEDGSDLYDGLLTRIDAVYGKPSETAERQPA